MMKLLNTVVLLATTAISSCPEDFQERAGKWYYFGTTLSDQRTAKEKCASLGSRLAKVTDRATARWICGNGGTEEGSNIWIGLEWMDGWNWADGSLFNDLTDYPEGQGYPFEGNSGDPDTPFRCGFLNSSCNYETDVCTTSNTAAFVCEAPEPSSNCPENFSQFGNKCYYVSGEQVLHNDAETACTDMGASLAKVTDQELAKNLCYTGTTWIGLTGTTNGWSWADGSEYNKETDFGGNWLPYDLPTERRCVYVDCYNKIDFHFFSLECDYPWNGRYACETALL